MQGSRQFVRRRRVSALGRSIFWRREFVVVVLATLAASCRTDDAIPVREPLGVDAPARVATPSNAPLSLLDLSLPNVPVLVDVMDDSAQTNAPAELLGFDADGEWRCPPMLKADEALCIARTDPLDDACLRTGGRLVVCGDCARICTKPVN